MCVKRVSRIAEEFLCFSFDWLPLPLSKQTTDYRQQPGELQVGACSGVTCSELNGSALPTSYIHRRALLLSLYFARLVQNETRKSHAD